MADEEFDEERLSALIADEISRADLFYGGSEEEGIGANRAENIEYMRGEMRDVKAAPHRSTVTSRDLSDVVSWTLPSLVRVFTSSGRMAEFEPEGPEDEQYCEQAGDYINYVFFRDNAGFRVLYDAIYDAIAIDGNGIVKCWWDDTPVTQITHHTGLLLEQIAALQEDRNIEVLTQEKGETISVPQMDSQTGEEVPLDLETYNIKIKRTKYPGCVKVICIEPENFLINEEAVEIEDFRFCAHRDPYKTRSDLVEMGFDPEKIDMVSAEQSIDTTEEGLARRQFEASAGQAWQESQERIELYECYIRIDVDNDGISETVKIMYAGNAGAGEVLHWEVWEDEVPFTKIPCYPVPHQFQSESLADRAKDIQRVKTILMRQGLDNLYASNLPMQEVYEGSILNPDILVNPKFGGTAWKKKGAPEKAIIRHEVPFVAGEAFNAMEFMDGVLERRTGVSRMSMALDPEALQNQTATGQQLARDAAYTQTELIARNMADGWRKVFRALLRIVVKHQDFPRHIRLKKDWVPMDPRVWSVDMDCTVNVGLGTGSKDRDMAMLSVLQANQKEIVAGLTSTGFAGEAIDMLPKLIDTSIKLGEAAGIRNADDYFPDFDEEKIMEMKQKAAQPKPNPEIEKEKMKIEAQVAMEREKAEIERQNKAEELQAKIAEEQLKAEGNAIKEREQLKADLQTSEADRRNQMLIEGQKLAWDREKFYAELDLRKQELELKRNPQANDDKDSGEAA